MKRYVLTDPSGRFFSHRSHYIPAIIHSFTSELNFAATFDDKEEAFDARDREVKWLYEFNGNAKVPDDYLRVAEVKIVTIEREP